MDRKRDREREDWIELADEDLEEPTVAEFNPVPTPTVDAGICPRCGGPGRAASQMELVAGFPSYCTWSGAKWFWCSSLRLLGCYVP